MGIAYSAGAQSWIFADTGLFYAYGGFAKENIDKAIKVILEELEKLKREKVADKELREAKEKDKAGLDFSLETPDGIANFYAVQQITEKKITTAKEMSEEIDKVTAEDVQRAARKYFIAKNLCLIIRGPQNAEYTEGFEKQVDSLMSK